MHRALFLSSRRLAAVAVAGAAIAVPSAFLSMRPAVTCEAPPAASFSAAPSSLAAPATALSPSEFRPFTVVAIEQLTPDTARYTLALPGEAVELGLSTSSCLVVRFSLPGTNEVVIRPYTPTSPARQRGTFDLVVKSYPNGKASKEFAALRVGSTVDCKGPFVKLPVTPNAWPAVGMLAGGTGITPMLQVVREVLADARDTTELRLIYASRSPSDVILHRELTALAEAHPNFKVLFTVDAVPAGVEWAGAVGHISPAQIAAFLPPPPAKGGAPSKILVCGPPGFMKTFSGEKASAAEQGALTGVLADMGFTADTVFKF